MPIRFECDQCGQRLSIARRKAGTEIDCPTCGRSQHVPGEPLEREPETPEDWPGISLDETVSGEEIEDEPADSGDVGEANQQAFIFAPTSSGPPPIPDEVDLSKTIDLDLTEFSEGSRVAGAATPPPPPAASEADRLPDVSLPRLAIPWAIYAQALLLLAVTAGAFSAGYYLGHQDGSIASSKSAEEAAAGAQPDDGFADEEVLLEGRILWTPSPGKSSGDGSASFIALPQDGIPRAALPILGLQPGGEAIPDAKASIAAIRAIGGVFTRAESNGMLAVVLPREGRYYVLMVSRNVRRSVDEPILARDLVDMKQYFAEPEALIGEQKYVWKSAEIRAGSSVADHDFGLDGL